MIKKQTYHSNSKYKVCAKILGSDQEMLDRYITIKNNSLELQDNTGEFMDKYQFSLNKIFTGN